LRLVDDRRVHAPGRRVLAVPVREKLVQVRVPAAQGGRPQEEGLRGDCEKLAAIGGSIGVEESGTVILGVFSKLAEFTRQHLLPAEGEATVIQRRETSGWGA